MLGSIHSTVLIAVVVMTGLNAILTVTKNVLDKVAAGSEADKIVGTIAGFAAKAIGFLSANTQALPEDVKAELPAPAQAPKA